MRTARTSCGVATASTGLDGSENTLIVEAGTGTGKTFAYLVPAMLWGGKVIVSTGTKHLQDQLFQRDIPTVRDALAGAGVGRHAQGARELPVPLLSAAHGGQRPFAVAPGNVVSAGNHPLRQDHAHRRQGRTRERAGNGAGLADGHVHARQLSRPGVPAVQGMLRDAGAPRGAAGGYRGGESPPVFRRHHVARHRHGRVAAHGQHHHLRRSASVARNRHAVFRRDAFHHAVSRTGPRCGGGRPGPRARGGRLGQARRGARTCGARRAAGVQGRFGAHVDRSVARRSSAVRRARNARRRELDALDAALGEQAERAESIGACLRRARELQGVLARLDHAAH